MASRRGFLQRTVAGAILGSTASLAGCTAPAIDFEAERREAGLGDVGDPTYRNWLPAVDPETDGIALSEHPMVYLDVDRYLDRGGKLSQSVARGALEPWSWGSFAGESEYPIATLDGILMVTDLELLTVIDEGDVPRGEVVETLSQRGYEDVGSHASEWRLFQKGDWERRAIGVGPHGVISVRSENCDELMDARERVTTLIETREGDRTRRHEASDAFERATEMVGHGMVTGLNHGGVAQSVIETEIESRPVADIHVETMDVVDSTYGFRSSLELSSDHPYRQIDQDADYREVNEDWLGEIGDSEATVVRAERAVDMFGTAPIEEPIGDPTLPVQPRVTIEFAYDVGTEEVLVRHKAGQAVPASELTVEAGEEPVPFDGDADPFDRGTTLRIDRETIDRNGRLNVRWVPEESEELAETVAFGRFDQLIPPAVELTIEYTDTGDRAIIENEGRDSVDTDRLTLVDSAGEPIEFEDHFGLGGLIETTESVTDRSAVVVLWEAGGFRIEPTEVELDRFEAPFDG